MKVHCSYDKMVLLDNLTPNPKNRNKHPKEQIKRLASIISATGWRKPIVVSKRSGFITAGHGRLEVAKYMSLKKVPVNFQDYASEAEEYADMTADNAIALWADLDLSGINEDIGDLGPDFDLDMMGLRNFTIDVADKSVVGEVNRGDESAEWVGMPEFVPGDKEIKLTLVFPTEKARAQFVEKHGFSLTSKHSNQWTTKL